MKLPNIAKIAQVKLTVIRNKACSIGPDAQVRIRLGLALQPAKREDNKGETNVEQTSNSQKQMQFNNTADARTQETAVSKETSQQEEEPLLRAD